MNKRIDYAKKAKSYCKMIKDGINGLCSMLDITDDTFKEMDRLGNYKSMFQKADDWEKQYENYIKKQE